VPGGTVVVWDSEYWLLLRAKTIFARGEIKMKRLSTICALLILTGCGDVDCSDKNAQAEVLNIVRENIVDALGRTNVPEFHAIYANMMIGKVLSGFGVMAPNKGLDSNLSVEKLQKELKLTFSTVSQISADRQSRVYKCNATVAIVDDATRIGGTVPITFTVSPELSGKVGSTVSLLWVTPAVSLQ
jgi:hypothetical protein